MEVGESLPVSGLMSSFGGYVGIFLHACGKGFLASVG